MENKNLLESLAVHLVDELSSGGSDMTIEPLWREMKAKERELLAQTVVQKCKDNLLKGTINPIEVFEIAKRIAPLSSKLEYHQSVFWFDYALLKGSEKYLLLAVKHIKHSIDIDPNCFNAWYVWGNILAHLGLAYHEAHYFQEADSKFEKAYHLCSLKMNEESKFLWDWALCWYFLGKHSGEAVDIRVSLQKFEKAFESGCRDAVFYRDFGNAWMEMGLLIKDVRFFEKALSYYEKACEFSQEYFDAFFSLSQAFHYLYDASGKERYLAQAHEAYAKASELNAKNFDLWVCWGKLFLLSGRRKLEPKHLQMSAMKFAKALHFSPNHPIATSLWGEALVLLGSYTARLDLLRQGEKKILETLKMEPESADLWCRYGYCLYAQGQYFEDVSYLSQSIEKYEYALSLDNRHFFSLYGLGLALFSVADLREDSVLFEKAEEKFSQALRLETGRAELYNDWGLLLMRIGEIYDEEKYITGAVEKFEKAVELQHDNPNTDYLYNYGCALDFLGCFNEEVYCHEKAAQVLSHVLYVDPDFKQVRYNLALVFAHLGELTSDIDYFTKSIAQFKLVVEEDQEDEMAYNEWGYTLLHLATVVYDSDRMGIFQKVLEDAEKRLTQAIALGSLKAIYYMACLFSLASHFGRAMYYLRQADSKKALPSIEDLLNDDFLESLRNTEDFRRFLKELSIKQPPQET